MYIPPLLGAYETKILLKSATLYCEDIEGSDLVLIVEIDLWKNKWAEIKNTPQIAVEA